MLFNIETSDFLLATEELEAHLTLLLVLLTVLFLHLLDFVLFAFADSTCLLRLPVLISLGLLFVFAFSLFLGFFLLLFQFTVGGFLVQLCLDVFSLLWVLRRFHSWVLPDFRGFSHLHHFDIFIVALCVRDNHGGLFFLGALPYALISACRSLAGQGLG